MQTTTAPPANAVLDEILNLIPHEFSPAHQPLAFELAKAYLRRLPPGRTRTTQDWLAEFKGIFEFVLERKDPISVRVFNPEREEHGYYSPGTAVEVNVDDGPFLLDSVTNEIQAHALEVLRVTHPVIGVERDSEGRLQSVGHARNARRRESVEHYELDRRLFVGDLPGLERAVRHVLTDVHLVVRDFHPMMDRINHMVEIVRQATGFYPQADIGEAIAFLQWLRDQNFVFLGYREYEVVETPEGRGVTVVAGSGLGVLSETEKSRMLQPRLISEMSPELAARYESGDLLVITKSNRLSTVHRRVKMDYVGVRIIGPAGDTVGEIRLLGLFTSKAFMEPAGHVPILRRKLAEIVATEDLIEGSHDHKAVIELFESFSKHDLFSAPVEELRHEIMGLLALQETHQVRLFMRRDLLERSVSVLVAMPRDRFNAELRRNLQDLFERRFNGGSSDYHLELGASDPARIHFTVWVDGPIPEVDYEQLESEVLDLTRSWADRLTEELSHRVEPELARQLVEEWADRFPDYYRVATPLAVTADDVLALEDMTAAGEPFRVKLRNESNGGEQLTRVVLYRSDGKQPLSELVPALEEMGMHVVEEVPTRLEGPDGYFIHDFGVVGGDRQPLDLAGCQDRVEAALSAVWAGEAESDPLNELVVRAGLSYWEVGIIRAYRVYWRRLAMSFTVGYLNDVLNANPGIVAQLVRLFQTRFHPGMTEIDPEPIRQSILNQLDEIPSLDHDRILRSFYRLIEATLRTNAYREGSSVLSFKLNSAEVPDMPPPVPFAEIFVYGPTVEGIHLRGGPVARGGIRWSDRREDYRTEVLGLMKAQMTKNAVIVPTGAKGGFVLRRPPTDPLAISAEVRTNYERYIRALLDITDNIVDQNAVHPSRVRVHDGPDPYLVVAADKGTATFSDLANQIAAEYGFWLDDAFASGGSAGYDHKALGITARGAWESLQRHFLELGIDPESDSFTAIGVGDMSGDVFGNGMLLSSTMKLVAAFDHRHIFIDPDPDPAVAFAERRRLFELPRSSWADYDRGLISPGGGVWPRSAKLIELAPEARRVLGVTQSSFTPNELISAVLRAPVDMFWNGGIGTYVKATIESNANVGDRSNDPVRIDASQLRTRVVVEGGNLGFTQAARVEYSLAGGRINTDFIDNSGGVNCSDREVNLKILLGLAEAKGEIDRAGRNQLIAEAADQVTKRILYDSFQQAQMISQEERATHRRLGAYEQLMVELELEGILDRRLEGLPSSELLAERGRNGQGLTRPELSVLLVDAKRSIYEALITTDLIDDPYFHNDLIGYFPEAVTERFQHLLTEHQLRREMIANILSNDVVNSMGSTFISRMCQRSGGSVVEVLRAYRLARDVSGAVQRWEALEHLLRRLDHDLWSELMTGADRVVGSLTRRYQAHFPPGDLTSAVRADREGFEEFEAALPSAGPEAWRTAHTAEAEELVGKGVPLYVARHHAYRRRLVHAPDAINLSRLHGRSVSEVAEVMFHAGEEVGLGHLEKLATGFVFTDVWQRWALEALEDDLLELRRRLTHRILQNAEGLTPADAVESFVTTHGESVERLRAFLRALSGERQENLAPLMIGVRQLRALID
ncbi:MAG TPA: NAD-glutamate dehydrogenase [Acidimicrobiia bacterium]|nr:NAD-glutamate dehydrogenase [Acidimicrobiia bacterium]